jgi:hypothetical protein
MSILWEVAGMASYSRPYHSALRARDNRMLRRKAVGLNGRAGKPAALSLSGE